MKNITKRSPNPTQKELIRRGIGLAWLIVVVGYCFVLFVGVGSQSFWGGYGLIVPPLLAVGCAIVLFVRGEPDIAGGIFLGLVYVFCVLIVSVGILFFYLINNSPQLVNGWK